MNCQKAWYYRVECCIFCKKRLDEINSEEYHVVTQTTVRIPTTKHPDVPYHLYLLRGNMGDQVLFKSFIQLDRSEPINLLNKTQIGGGE